MEFDSVRRSGTARAGTVALWVSVVLACAVSLWLRQAFPVYAIGNGVHDDQLFVRLAQHLYAGEWLGPYSNLTLAKGAAYSGFVAVNHALGFPLKVSEHVVYLLCALYFSMVVGAQFVSRAASAVLFALLAFNPVLWSPEVGGRVVRENLYISLTLLVVALGIRVYVARHVGSIAEELREKRWLLAALGVAGALFWLTREEGAWLAPSVLILLGYWLATHFRRRPLRQLTLFLAIPLLSFAAIVGTVDTINYAKYGVFRNNDFRSRDFQAAYGALARVRHDQWVPRVVFPADARARAYSVSPAARELKPHFEGDVGSAWRNISCEQMRRTGCPEILSGWFMWALRDATTAAGHYGSATDNRRFYRQLAREVNAACDTHAIACGPPNASLIPPWHESFLAATFEAAQRVFPTVAALGNSPVGFIPSAGSEEELRFFQTMINEPPARVGDALSTDVRIPIARRIAALEIGLAKLALPLSFVAWLVLLVLAIVKRRWHPGQIIAAALIAGVAMRGLLLSFLEATSMPSNNGLYPSPATPLVIAIGPCVLFLWVRYRTNSRGSGA